MSLADFVGNLGTNALVTKPIDIVNSEVEASGSGTQAPDLIKFSVKAPLTPRTPPRAAGTAAAPGAAGAPGTPVAAAAQAAR